MAQKARHDFPNPDEPVLARIEELGNGGMEYSAILVYDGGWWSLAERRPLYDTQEQVIDWRYVADCFAPLEEVNE